MMKKLRQPNLWMITILLSANLVACLFLVMLAPPEYSCPIAEPKRDAEVVQLLDYIRSGEDRSGETWTVTLSEQEAEETITWYLTRYPQIPFAHPCLTITPDYISGEGDATIAGLRVHVGMTVQITLQDGLPIVDILNLTLPIPNAIREGLEAELQRQLQRAEELPVRFISAEWREGEVTVQGYIR